MQLTNNQLQATLDAVEREACKDSFYEFLISFWDTVIPETMVLNWHIKYLCDDLQGLSHFIVNRLPKPYDQVTNIPPGTTKSTIYTVMWPAWLWTQDATIRILTNSHADDLAIQHATKSKDIIQSDKYKRLFPEVELRKDKSAKGHYANTKGGERYTTSTGSSAIGEHAHVIINDDPSNPKVQFSDAIKEQGVQKVKELSTRKVDKRNTITLTIMQRLHEQDTTGYLLGIDPDIHHICLPAEVSRFVNPPELKEYYVDGLLDPIRQSAKVLADAKRELGSVMYSGQYDQSPVVEGGNIVKEEWFQYCSFEYFMSIKGNTPMVFLGDTAFTKDKENDPSGLVATCKVNNILYIVNFTTIRKEFPELIRYINSYAYRWFYGPGSSFRIEPKANGKSVVQELRRKSLINIVDIVSPMVAAGKRGRLQTAAPSVESQRVVLVEAPWNDEFVGQITGFPNKTHDEAVDLLSYAVDFHLFTDVQEINEAYDQALKLLG